MRHSRRLLKTAIPVLSVALAIALFKLGANQYERHLHSALSTANAEGQSGLHEPLEYFPPAMLLSCSLNAPAYGMMRFVAVRVLHDPDAYATLFQPGGLRESGKLADSEQWIFLLFVLFQWSVISSGLYKPAATEAPWPNLARALALAALSFLAAAVTRSLFPYASLHDNWRSSPAVFAAALVWSTLIAVACVWNIGRSFLPERPPSPVAK